MTQQRPNNGTMLPSSTSELPCCLATQGESLSPAERCHVLHVALNLSRAGAGVSAVAWEVGLAQRRRGMTVHWTCAADRSLADDVAAVNEDVVSSVHPFRAYGPRQLAWMPGVREAVARLVDDSDVVHIHGIWSSLLHTASSLATKRQTPHVVSPHGMLQPWALQHRRWRKLVASLLVERRFLGRANCLHALVEAEYHDIRRFGIDTPVAIIPNGIDLGAFDGVNLMDQRPPLWPQLNNRQVALFLSRIHAKKGIPVLIEAWREATRNDNGWVLAIAGPDEDGHLAEVQRLARCLGVEDRVVFTGPAYGNKKKQLLQLAEFFVLPSHSEGFSMAVLEAMACRLPVIITPSCNFAAVSKEGAGLIVQPRVVELAGALRGIMECSLIQRKQMGEQARRLVERYHTWDRVVEPMNDVYQWLIHGGAPPACVVTD